MRERTYTIAKALLAAKNAAGDKAEPRDCEYFYRDGHWILRSRMAQYSCDVRTLEVTVHADSPAPV